MPVDAGTISTNLSGTKDAASQEVKKNVSSLRYIALPNWAHDALLKFSSSKPQDHYCTEVLEGSGNPNPTASTSNPPADQMETLTVETPIPTVSSPVLTAYSTDSQEPSSDARLISKRVANQVETPYLDNILSLTNRFEDILRVTTNSDESNGAAADISNMETTITASPTPTLRIHKDHPKSQIIGLMDTLIQTRNKSKENVWTSVDCPKRVRPIGTKWVLKNKKDERGIVIRNKDRLVAQGHTQDEGIDYDKMDVKSVFLYGTIDKEVYVMQPLGFQDPESPAKVYKVEKAMYGLHQAPRAWYGTLSKYLLKIGFQRGTIDQTLFIRRQRGDFILVQVCVDDIIFRSSNPQLCREFDKSDHQILPRNKENHWGKDRTRKDVDIHLYRSMIGSLMYLTASRPDIMFAVCACARHQTIVATSTTEAEYVAAASCCGQVIDCFEKKLINVDHIHTDENVAGLLTKSFDVGRFQYLVSEHNADFYPMVDFIEASPLRIETTDEGTQILAIVDGIHRTISESSLRRNLKLQDEDGISSLPDTELFENLTLMGYNISLNQKFTFQKGTPTEPHHTPYLEAQSPSHTTHTSPTLPPVTTTSLPTVTQSDTPIVRQYTKRTRIAQSSVLSTVADEPASPLRDVSQGEACPTNSSFIADQDRATINNGSIPTASTPAEEQVPTGSDVVPTASTPAEEKVPTGSDVVLWSIPIEEGKARKSWSKQIARDAEIARIHAEEELQIMIDGLNRDNEIVAKYLQEYHQFASKLPIERRIELITDLVKYQDNYAKIYKYHSQQRKPMTKKQKRDYYMAVIRNNLGWKAKDFRGMTFKEVEAKFNSVWKQMEDFIPMGSKEVAKRIKRKGLNLEQESAKKQKTSEEVPEEAMFLKEVPEEKVKEMMQLVPIEEVYVEALQFKHPIIDWKVYTEGQRSYWKITRNLHASGEGLPSKEGSSTCDDQLQASSGELLTDGKCLILKIYKIANSPRQQGKEIAKPITPLSKLASNKDSDPEQAQRDKDMQKNLALISKYFKKIYKPTNNNLRTSSNSRNKNMDTTPRKPKRVKDSAYHKEKMLLCKQAEKGVPLQAEQYDWLADTDEEIHEHKTLGKSNSVRDSCLVALQNKQTEFEKYNAFNDRTIDYDKLKHKLNETLRQLAQKDVEIKEGLKLKAYEISVVKEKHDELIKQSLLTKSHYEGLIKQKIK
nr:hypothetical protein [Tanacetum cinerariifolium]